MSSEEIQKMQKMCDRVVKEEELIKRQAKAQKPAGKPKRKRPPPSKTAKPSTSMAGKIFCKPKKYSRLLEMRENLAKAREIRRQLQLKEEDEEDEGEDYEVTDVYEDLEIKSISSVESNYSVDSKDFKPVEEATVDSDEELLKTFETTERPELPPNVNAHSLDEFFGTDDLSIVDSFPDLLPGELPPNPETLCEELEQNHALYREVFRQSPNQNMGEILTPTVTDWEVPPIDMDELFDVALIETDEQIYEENFLRHSMALAVFEDKNIDELKELLEDVKKLPL